MVKRLRSLMRALVRPEPLRGRHVRGAALPPRASTPTIWCAPGCRWRKPGAARAWNSAGSKASRTTAARLAGCACSTRSAATRATRFDCCRRSPGFTATALATLAICIGANLTIFAVVDALLLRPLPFPDADRLMSVYNTYPKAGVPNDGASLTNYYDRRGKIAAFEGVSAYRTGTAVIGESGATEQVPTMWVSADYFATLGVTPVMGRPFTEAEMEYGATHVAIVTDSFWRQRLGGDQGALGRTIRVGGAPTTVVGILPPDFRFLSSKTRVYFPLASSPEERSQRQRHSGNSHMVARLRAGVPVAQAQAEIDAHNAMLEAGNPEGKAMADAGFRSIVVPLRADHVAAVRSIVLLLCRRARWSCCSSGW